MKKSPFLLSILFLFSLNITAQFTSVQAGDWDNCATWGACPGSVIGTNYPGRTDNVTIAHAVSVNNTLDNSASNTQPNDEAIAGVCGCTGSGNTGCGNNPTGCNTNGFYHKGSITINSGGTLTSTVLTVFEGDVEINSGGAFRLNANSTTFLIGRVDVRTGGSFISNQNLVISGDAIFNIESGSTAGVGDDLYLDGDNNFVCGAGTLDLDGPAYYGGPRNNSIRHYNTTDNTTTDQICSNTTITCADGDCCGGQCDADIGSSAGAGDGEINPADGDGSAESSTVLPVELLYFSWKEYSSDITLNWATSVEINNDRFDIYQSNDGNNFRKVHTQLGSGNSNQRIEYSFVDKSAVSGASYYRLVQIDFNGETDTLGTIRAFSNTTNLFSIYPNPTSNKINLILGNEFINTTTFFRVSDISGREVVFKSEWISTQTFPIDLSLDAGIYFIEVSNGNFSHRERLIVK